MSQASFIVAALTGVVLAVAALVLSAGREAPRSHGVPRPVELMVSGREADLRLVQLELYEASLVYAAALRTLIRTAQERLAHEAATLGVASDLARIRQAGEIRHAEALDPVELEFEILQAENNLHAAKTTSMTEKQVIEIGYRAAVRKLLEKRTERHRGADPTRQSIDSAAAMSRYTWTLFHSVCAEYLRGLRTIGSYKATQFERRWEAVKQRHPETCEVGTIDFGVTSVLKQSMQR